MRDTPYRRVWSASLWLIILSTVAYAAQLILPLILGESRAAAFENLFALHPRDLIRGYVWQLLTFQFLHGGPFHLLINCAMLYMFGRPVEEVLGRTAFLRFYLFSGAVGGLVQVALGALFPMHIGMGPVLGASAGVFALIAAFAALNWEQPLTMLLALVFPVTIKAKYLILVEVIIGLLGLLQPGSGIAHAAHLGGIAAGLVYVRFILTREFSFFRWPRIRVAAPRRELVKTPSDTKSPWQRAKNEELDALPSSEFISKEVDPILDKISAHGIQSLTPRERRILEAARAKMAKR